VTAIRRGGAIGAAVGAGGLLLLLIITRLLLGMRAAPAGLVFLAVPLVVLPSLSTAILAGGSSFHRRSSKAAAEKGAMLYLSAFVILWLLIVALALVVHQKSMGESFLALPVALLLCLFLGAPTTAVAAILVQRLYPQDELSANGA
jgi:hypothetical protein